MDWLYCWAQDPGDEDWTDGPVPFFFHVWADTSGGYGWFQTIRGHNMLYTRLQSRGEFIDSYAQLN